VTLRVRDITHGERIAARTIVMQQKTQRPVQFEITEQTRDSVATWTRLSSLRSEDYLFPSRLRSSPHLSTRQYARIVHQWVKEIGLNPAAYGTHTLRRTKASRIYRRTKNMRAVQLLSGHSKLDYVPLDIDSRALCGISVSKSTTRSRWPNRRKCSSRDGRSAAACRSLTGQQLPVTGLTEHL